MTDTKMEDLTQDTSPTKDDLMVTVNDPLGTPADRYVRLEDLFQVLTDLTANASPAGEDLIVTIDDPSGTPLVRKVTAVDLFQVLTSLTANTAPVGEDLLVSIDDPSGTPLVRKVTINNLFTKTEVVEIPGGFIRPTVSNGCASPAAVEHTANQPETYGPAFDGTTQEYGTFSLTFPAGVWDLGTLTYIIEWATSATDTDGVVFGLQARASGDGEAKNGAYGTAVEVSDNAQSTTYLTNITAESGALTVGNTPADGDRIDFQVYRDPTDGSDTIAEDVIIEKILIFYTTDARDVVP